MNRLDNRIALVTGARQGIGRAIAERFISEGAIVICADINPDISTVTADLGEHAHPLVLDVTSEGAIVKAFEWVGEKWGRLDVLCNNAGISGRKVKLLEQEANDFDQLITMNLKSVFLMMRHGMPLMKLAGGGSVVNIASTAGLTAVPGRPIYSATKAGVIGLTRTVAVEYGTENIRANCICPGGTETPQFKAVNTEETAAALMSLQAIKRIGLPNDIAAAAAFLASDDACFVTGLAIAVDGGLTAS
jgi:meso-butanediol dehydrogenase / (S,S)-butanediol dehydrogenase / diacetyl reductase